MRSTVRAGGTVEPEGDLHERQRHDRYLATEEPDGTLTLTPAVVMTELEAKLLRSNPELVKELEAKMLGPERLTRRPLPSR